MQLLPMQRLLSYKLTVQKQSPRLQLLACCQFERPDAATLGVDEHRVPSLAVSMHLTKASRMNSWMMQQFQGVMLNAITSSVDAPYQGVWFMSLYGESATASIAPRVSPW